MATGEAIESCVPARLDRMLGARGTGLSWFRSRDMDSRWSGSHVGCSTERNLDASRHTWINRHKGRRERELLSRLKRLDDQRQ